MNYTVTVRWLGDEGVEEAVELETTEPRAAIAMVETCLRDLQPSVEGAQVTEVLVRVS
jgi:hypothetical protein